MLDAKYCGYPEGLKNLTADLKLPEYLDTPEKREAFVFMQINTLIMY